MEIKDIYLSVYKKKLAEEILENYNGVLQRILLGLLHGMYNGIKLVFSQDDFPQERKKKKVSLSKSFPSVFVHLWKYSRSLCLCMCEICA